MFVDPKTIEAKMNWPTPKNVTNVIYFMSLTGYDRIFIMGFSKIAHPINSLQKKGIKFEWKEDYRERFQVLKKLLDIAPILKIVYLDKYFVVCINDCVEGLGGLLFKIIM
jgi:hypothetical protein